MKLADLVARYLGAGNRSVLKVENGPSVTDSGLASEPSPGRVNDLPASIDDWPQDRREDFEERAVIMEFDGNLPRTEAERSAEVCVREAFRRLQEARDGP